MQHMHNIRIRHTKISFLNNFIQTVISYSTIILMEILLKLSFSRLYIIIFINYYDFIITFWSHQFKHDLTSLKKKQNIIAYRTI